jgi:CubicO group peptidase (beta-lactamase class C family)
MAVAMTAGSKLIYARGFGFADQESSTAVKPTSLFRIASVSKPFTSVAVMKLVERKKIKLDDPIRRYVTLQPFIPAGKAIDPRWEKISVRHCLQHSGGWNRSRSIDPMGAAGNVQIAAEMGLQTPVAVSDLIRYMLGQPLDFDPGTSYGYSNFGYCLLGRVIETASGVSYEDFMQKEILAPLKITRMRLGRNLLEDRFEDEVRYYDGRERKPVAVLGPNRGQAAAIQYGSELIESMDANGGWLASAVDVVRFATAFDDASHCPLLKYATVGEMLSPPTGSNGHSADGKAKAVYYACGWSFRPVAGSRAGGTKWHGGALAGSGTLLVCRHDGVNWCVLFNGDSNADGKEFASLIDSLMHQVVDQIGKWPRNDLFARFLK